MPIRSLIALLLLLLAGCGEPRKGNGRADAALPKGGALDEDGAQTLVARGYRLYRELGTMGGKEHGEIAGRRAVQIDPAKAASMKALRSKLGEVFTGAAIDSILADFGVAEQGGKLWMNDAGKDAAVDISDYDEAAVLDLSNDSTKATATIDVPLGDSGQSDERTIQFRKTASGWKIANDIFGGESLSVDDADADSTDS